MNITKKASVLGKIRRCAETYPTCSEQKRIPSETETETVLYLTVLPHWSVIFSLWHTVHMMPNLPLFGFLLYGQMAGQMNMYL